MIEKKRILFLSPFIAWPPVNGAVSRIFYLAYSLAETNELQCVFRSGGEDLLACRCQVIFNTKNRLLQIFNPILLWRLTKLVYLKDIDFILNSHLWSGLHGVLLKWLTKRPLVYDAHNVEFLRFKRVRSYLWPFVKLFEDFVCRRADAIFCVSEDDLEVLKKSFSLPSEKFQVVENGVDASALSMRPAYKWDVRKQFGIGEDVALLLFYGRLDYAPNIQAVDILLEQILPMLDSMVIPYVMVIAGGGTLQRRWVKRERTEVIFTGFVEDLGSLIQVSDLVVVPLLSGSGTRFKILESVGYGTRVLSTSIGAEGLRQELFGDALVIKDGWDNFVNALSVLIKKPLLCVPKAFLDYYDWQKVVSRINL